MKLIYFDVETTGLVPGRYDIHQLSYLIEIDGQIRLERDWKIRPFRPYNIDVSALDVCGKTTKEILSYPHPDAVFRMVIKDFTGFVDQYNPGDKMYPVAYNGHFDYQFLTTFFNDCGFAFFGSFVNHRLIDPLAILRFYEFCGVLKFDSYKLSNVCCHFGIPITAHDALSDIHAARALLYKLKEIVSFTPFSLPEEEKINSDFLDTFAKNFE